MTQNDGDARVWLRPLVPDDQDEFIDPVTVLTREADEFLGSYHDGPLLGCPRNGHPTTAAEVEQPFVA